MVEGIIAAVQMASEPGEAQDNAEKVIGWASTARREGATLVFFPECCLTGFVPERAGEDAISTDSNAVREVEEFARRSDIAIGFGFAEKHGGALPFNTYVVASRDERLMYRKTHLGASEQPFFSAGDELPVAQIAGMRVGVQLCWEAHIGDIAATLRAKGAELVLAPHAGGLGGQRRLDAWSRYLPARALDNGLFVVACNAVRRDGTSEATDNGGGMAAYGPDGAPIASYGGFDEHMVLARIGGPLPRDLPQTGMRGISFFDRRRPELYA